VLCVRIVIAALLLYGSLPVIMMYGAGAGYYYMRLFERLVRGTWTPTSNEILQPTL
jgi:hypothetical protein